MTTAPSPERLSVAAAQDDDIVAMLLPRFTQRLLFFAENADSRIAAARAVAAASDGTDADIDIALQDDLRLLGEMLRASDGEAEAASLALRKLTRNSWTKVSIAKAEAIPPLVALLENGTDLAQENAVAALGKLADDNHNNKVLIAKAGAIAGLVDLLQNGTIGAKENAAGVLWTLAEYNNENKVLIAKAGAIPQLVALVQNVTLRTYSVRHLAKMALRTLSYS